ncbi:hypothetical protein EI94DRAFT_1812184 [Lactarius quietus]|nr:hypothetical protein EI94DRAFT_1812184 [Lactarius quietus]
MEGAIVTSGNPTSVDRHKLLSLLSQEPEVQPLPLPQFLHTHPTPTVTPLAARITSGEYKSLAAGWISSINTAALSDTTVPTGWASDANAYDCTVVFDFESGQDLCTSSYFDDAIPAIELQITKQGYRLAAWLNTVFD